ncbi:MAG TPA: hypothetical protein VK427_09950, partial [Kofleriaceae bacterium]|nr:hypothetical protein [Kofleriaceae bacterium]
PATSNGNCTFTPKFTADTMLTTFAWARSHLRTVDWNGDGNVDIGAPHGVLGGDGDEAYTLVFGDGSGKFPLGYSEQFDPDDVIPKDLAFWDMSGDGRLDVLIAGENGVVLQRRIP